MQKLFQVWLSYSLTSCCQVAIIYKASEQVYNQMFYNLTNFWLSLKQGMGNPGIGESGNRGIRESGNRGIRESGNPELIRRGY